MAFRTGWLKERPAQAGRSRLPILWRSLTGSREAVDRSYFKNRETLGFKFQPAQGYKI